MRCELQRYGIEIDVLKQEKRENISPYQKILFKLFSLNLKVKSLYKKFQK